MQSIPDDEPPPDEPATQEDPFSNAHDEAQPATQEEPSASANADEDESVVNDENSGVAASGSTATIVGGLADPPPGILGSRPVRPEPHMAKRAEVSWGLVDDPAKLSRTISIDRLPHEHKRMRLPSLVRQPSEYGIDRRVVSTLLRPGTWTPAEDGSFPLMADEVLQLAEAAQHTLEAEPTLLQIVAPVKVFGDIHGQYADLMRLFDQYGAPSRDHGGDINIIDYLFLGDYVDPGKHSLEVICLLLALKIQFPNKIFLVRGNHESMEVNARDGFLHECVNRLGGRESGLTVWRRLNVLFEWMPMGAVINGCILAVHGGIGKHIEGPEQIAAMQRPLRMGGAHASLLLDLLWSDPTSSDSVQGVHTNVERGHPVVCFGPDRVSSFLERNGLSLILRAHECVMDGFQRFAGGRLITIFSATNYCNRWGNAGAIVQISLARQKSNQRCQAWIGPTSPGPHM